MDLVSCPPPEIQAPAPSSFPPAARPEPIESRTLPLIDPYPSLLPNDPGFSPPAEKIKLLECDQDLPSAMLPNEDHDLREPLEAADEASKIGAQLKSLATSILDQAQLLAIIGENGASERLADFRHAANTEAENIHDLVPSQSGSLPEQGLPEATTGYCTAASCGTDKDVDDRSAFAEIPKDLKKSFVVQEVVDVDKGITAEMEEALGEYQRELPASIVNEVEAPTGQYEVEHSIGHPTEIGAEETVVLQENDATNGGYEEPIEGEEAVLAEAPVVECIEETSSTIECSTNVATEAPLNVQERDGTKSGCDHRTGDYKQLLLAPEVEEFDAEAHEVPDLHQQVFEAPEVHKVEAEVLDAQLDLQEASKLVHEDDVEVLDAPVHEAEAEVLDAPIFQDLHEASQLINEDDAEVQDVPLHQQAFEAPEVQKAEAEVLDAPVFPKVQNVHEDEAEVQGTPEDPEAEVQEAASFDLQVPPPVETADSTEVEEAAVLDEVPKAPAFAETPSQEAPNADFVNRSIEVHVKDFAEVDLQVQEAPVHQEVLEASELDKAVAHAQEVFSTNSQLDGVTKEVHVLDEKTPSSQYVPEESGDVKSTPASDDERTEELLELVQSSDVPEIATTPAELAAVHLKNKLESEATVDTPEVESANEVTRRYQAAGEIPDIALAKRSEVDDPSKSLGLEVAGEKSGASDPESVYQEPHNDFSEPIYDDQLLRGDVIDWGVVHVQHPAEYYTTSEVIYDNEAVQAGEVGLDDRHSQLKDTLLEAIDQPKTFGDESKARVGDQPQVQCEKIEFCSKDGHEGKFLEAERLASVQFISGGIVNIEDSPSSIEHQELPPNKGNFLGKLIDKVTGKNR